MLAGVGVTLQDSNTVDVKDLGAQFFLTQDDVGKNVCVRSNYGICGF